MSVLLTLYKNRTTRETITVTDADGDNVDFESGDTFRVKIGRTGAAPLLDLDSDAASANGSTVQAANPSIVVLDQDDVETLSAGVYDCEVSIVDASDGNRIKHADKGVCVVHGTQAGSIS